VRLGDLDKLDQPGRSISRGRLGDLDKLDQPV